MDFELKTLTPNRLASEKSDALIILVPQNLGAIADAKDTLSVLIRQAVESGDLQCKPGKLLSAWKVPGIAASRVLLAGVEEADPQAVRKALLAAMASLKGSNARQALLSLHVLPVELQSTALHAAVIASSDAAYVYQTTLSKAPPERLERMVVCANQTAAIKTAFFQVNALVLGIALAKEWANRPANYATPTLLAEAAKNHLGKLPNIKVEILDPKEVASLAMGSFMAVAQGSAEPLRFIVLHYTGASKAEAPTVLIGKGITFDTGGISIKPAAEMDEMKYDMCGAASVLGTFRTLAELQPRINVVGLIPACENMPGSRAVKPGDVVVSMSGQTIEILNTDAEGRLVLCDALTYAERFKPRAVIDIATLTGACVVALGSVRSGLFSTSDALAAELAAAGEAAHDLCWRMPLDDEYAEGLKTNFADVANIAGRAGGAVTAAKFLQRFAKNFDWAHLDIAGTAWKGGSAKGASGRPVGLLVEYLLRQAAIDPALRRTTESAQTTVLSSSSASAVTRRKKIVKIAPTLAPIVSSKKTLVVNS